MTPAPASARLLSRVLSRRAPRLVVFVVAAALFVRLAAPVGAETITPQVTQQIGSVTSVDVTPFPAATNTSSVTVTVSGARNASNVLITGAVAASMCGNADTGGTPYAILPAGNAACDGTNQAGDITFVVFANGEGTFTKSLKASGIGDVAATCVTGATLPCLFGLGDVATSGAAFAVGIPVFPAGGGVPPTTTTTAAPGPTTTVAPGATTTTTAPGATTTTVAPGATTTTSTTTTKPPGTPALAASPNTNLADGQKVRITATGLSAFEGQAVALTQCGNATTAGAPIATVVEADCFGADAVGTQLFIGTVSGGKYETDYVVRRSGIGANRTTCIAATNPCVMALADVASVGKKLRITAPITFAAPTSTTTTTVPTAVLGAVQQQPGSGGLAVTGSTTRTVVMVVLAVGLLEFGWLFATGARRPRRSTS